jgi:hypothetical protein
MAALPELLGGEQLHPMTVLCYQALGPAMTAGDEGEWLLLKFMDALVHHLKPVWDMVLSNDERPGWWDAFNPYARPGQLLPWLPWLAQFTGDTYDTSLIGIDPFAESPDQVNRDKVARLRNWRRGTIPAITETILERIPQGALVSIFERYQANKAHMHIRVYTSVALSTKLEGAILQAVAASIPAGDTFDFDVLNSPSFEVVAASLSSDTFAARQSRYPRFSDLPTVREAPYKGPLPPQATEVAVTTWDQIETLIGSWNAITAYGSWEGLETAGDVLTLGGS